MEHDFASTRISASRAGAVLTLLLACSDPSDPATPVPGDSLHRDVAGTEDPGGEPAAAADSFVNSIAVQTHLGYTGRIYDTAWATIIRPRLLELGVRHVRDRLSTKAKVIGRLTDLAANGIRLTAGCWPSDGVMTDASHCIAMANAHGTEVIDALEGWNEVDKTGTDWATNWVLWQTTLYATYEADGTWQHLPVVASSLARPKNADRLGNRSAIFDFGNLHSYPGSDLPSTVSKVWIPQWDKIAAPKPHWATETGYNNCLTCSGAVISERASGKYYSRLWFEYFNRGVVRTAAYELIDQGVSGSQRSHHWGLLRHDGTPKPQFTATRNLIALLGDPGPPFAPGRLAYTLSDSTGAIHSTLLQKRDGRFYLALWQEVTVWKSKTKIDISNPTRAVTITLPTSATLRVYGPLQTDNPIQEDTGTSITVQVPDEVVVVEIAPSQP